MERSDLFPLPAARKIACIRYADEFHSDLNVALLRAEAVLPIVSGHLARKGFRYQDLYLLLRMLEVAGKELDQCWIQPAPNFAAALDTLPIRFGIEASPRPDNAGVLDWDVLVSNAQQLELAEVKSGSVDKDDRIAFWRRLRRELSSTSPQDVIPILVVDPDALSDLSLWSGFAKAVRDSSPSKAVNPLKGNVTSSEKLLQEAMWYLCGENETKGAGIPQPVQVDAARAVLQRFAVHPLIYRELEQRVEALIEILFPSVASSTYETLLLGWLNQRATAPAAGQRLFTIRELLAEIGVLRFSEIFAGEKLQTWRNLWNEVPEAIRSRTRVRLGRSGRSVSSTDIQPAAVGALMHDDQAPLLLKGNGGAGKSTFVAQAAAAAEQRGEVVFWCGADDVSVDEIDELANAFRFRASLSFLRNQQAPIRILVDGLDEASGNKRERWAEILARLPGIRNVRIVASVRETIWRVDGNLRQKIGTWRVIDLALWTKPLVENLLSETKFSTALPESVIQLLRTPILLDLFWRTFVEAERPDLSRAGLLRTRHELLAAFWQERLIHPTRSGIALNNSAELHDVWKLAASVVGSFKPDQSSAPAIALLLSEGVLVEEGRLQQRLNFRHPLLRDFALAQWSLGSSSVSDAARQWHSVKGGLQKYGALRAIAEALSSSDAGSEYPSLALPDFVRAAIECDSRSAEQIAQLLGSLEDITGSLDPNFWPLPLRNILPSNFGSAVLSAARLNQNLAWAKPSEQWSEGAGWIDERFANVVWQYAEWLRETAKKNGGASYWREASRCAARKLRALAETPRFTDHFAEFDGWLTTQAVCAVAPVLPDPLTLSWLERAVSGGTWRVRSFALEQLIHVAAVDADRTANLYRVAVGIVNKSGEFHLDVQRWRGLMPEQAIDWSLAGDENHRSLIGEFPAAFFPVALELAEALFRHEVSSREQRGLAELMDTISCSSADDISTSSHEPRTPESLIDDLPDWAYWRKIARGDARERCLTTIHTHAQAIVKGDIALAVSSVIPALRRSRLGSVRSIALDVLLECKANLECENIIAEELLDQRLYRISGMDYWLEQGLIAGWPRLKSDQRGRVQSIIAALLIDKKWVNRAKSLLVRLPKTEWRTDLQWHRPDDADDAFRAARCPSRRDDDDDSVGGEWLGRDERADEAAPGLWPENFDRAALLEFYRATNVLSQANVGAEKLQAELERATRSGLNLLVSLKVEPPAMLRSENSWIWDALKRTLDSYRKFEGETHLKNAPRLEFTSGCGFLGIAVLREVPSELPGKLPEGDVWTGFRETSWTRALALVDEALTWEPLANDASTQGEFVMLLEAAFASGDPLVQLTCCTSVRPWHWLRSPDRRMLFRRLVWEKPTEPKVLEWSLGTALRSGDRERTEIFRLLLNRADLRAAEGLAGRLGEYIGSCSLLWFNDDHRSLAADLTREIVAAASSFALLREDAHLRAFWRGFAFGLKERAKLVSSFESLATDYGRWMLKAWRELVIRRQKRNESESVVLFAMHWLERKEGTNEAPERARPWWESLQPLLSAVATDGGTPDCFNLFFNLRGGEFNYVAKPEEILGLVEIFTDRIIAATTARLIDLDQRNAADGEHHSWRDCAEYAASGIDALNKGGVLVTDLQRDRAHTLLSRLVSAPLRSANASAALHALQSN